MLRIEINSCETCCTVCKILGRNCHHATDYYVLLAYYYFFKFCYFSLFCNRFIVISAFGANKRMQCVSKHNICTACRTRNFRR